MCSESTKNKLYCRVQLHLYIHIYMLRITCVGKVYFKPVEIDVYILFIIVYIESCFNMYYVYILFGDIIVYALEGL